MQKFFDNVLSTTLEERLPEFRPKQIIRLRDMVLSQFLGTRTTAFQAIRKTIDPWTERNFFSATEGQRKQILDLSWQRWSFGQIARHSSYIKAISKMNVKT